MKQKLAALCLTLLLLTITVSAAICVHIVRKPHHTKATIAGWHKWCETHDCSKPTKAEAIKTLDLACSWFELLPTENSSPLLTQDAALAPPAFDAIQLPSLEPAPDTVALSGPVPAGLGYPVYYPPFTTPGSSGGVPVSAAAPEPLSLVLFGTGFLGCALLAVRRRAGDTSAAARCCGCGRMLDKSSMTYSMAYGWFCCEGEAYLAWIESQV